MGIPDPHHDSQFYEGVPLRRFLAFWIDTAVVLGLWFVGAIALAIVTLGFGIALIPILLPATAFGYRWLMLFKRSATLGMKLTGIEVRLPTGEPLDKGTAALHTLLFMVTLGFLPAAIVGWILMASSPERRALHDLPFGTVVINRPT